MGKCTAITREGGRCRGVAIDGSGLCYMHDPDHEQDRRRAARKGGKRGGRGRPQVEIGAVKTQLQDLVEGVLGGKTLRADAAVVGQILNVYLRALSVGLQVREQEELVERLEDLETLLEQQNGRGYGA